VLSPALNGRSVAISQRIQQVFREVLQVQQGSLYRALHRLKYNGWLQAQWREKETGRQARFYSLACLTQAVQLILETSE